MSRPENLGHDDFVAAVKDAWSKSGVHKRRNQIVVAKKIDGWAAYMTKFRSANDEVDVQNLEWKTNQAQKGLKRAGNAFIRSGLDFHKQMEI